MQYIEYNEEKKMHNKKSLFILSLPHIHMKLVIMIHELVSNSFS
jgi:two-component sensor histidine kinase